MRGGDAIQIVHPHGGIHDDHQAHSRPTRPERSSSKLPCHLTLPRKRRTPVCALTWISNCKPASTTAFLVGSPVARMAWAINSLSITMFVRIMDSGRLDVYRIT